MSRFRVPHTLILLVAVQVLALIGTWTLPQGQFERVTNDAGREQVVAGSYAPLTADRPGLLRLFTAIPEGFAAAGDIIFFVLIIGGAFGVLRATGALDALIASLLRRFAHRPKWLVAGGITIFAVGSSTIGMAEEYIPFVPVLLALALALRFDAVTAVGILACGMAVGYGVAVINPFTLIVAQDVAGLTPTSGMGYRLLLTVGFVSIAVHHVWRYAARVRQDPETSLVADIPPPVDVPNPADHPMTTLHRIILAITVAAVALLVWGLSQASGWHWYIGEMGAMFLGLTLVYGLVSAVARARGAPALDANGVAEAFCDGAAELTSTALLIGFARSILILLEDGQVIDTIVYGLSLPLEQAGPGLAAVGMLAVQTATNFFIPSGSGQAYVTMPVMAPLADLTGVSRQTAVLAFQFGDGFANILVPTNAVLIGILTIARIPYDRWLRFVLPFMFKVWAAAALALAVAVWTGY